MRASVEFATPAEMLSAILFLLLRVEVVGVVVLGCEQVNDRVPRISAVELEGALLLGCRDRDSQGHYCVVVDLRVRVPPVAVLMLHERDELVVGAGVVELEGVVKEPLLEYADRPLLTRLIR